MPYQTIDPSSGETLKTYPDIADGRLDEVIATAHRAYETDWRNRSIAQRAEVVSRAAAILREKAEEYAQILTREMGKLINEARGEVGLSASILDYYAANAARFLAPRAIPESPGAELHLAPIGVILAIEPWNFPYYQVVRVAGPQLMAGNVIVLKHAGNVPEAALALDRLFEEAGAPPGVYTNVFANADQIGKVIEDPRVRGVTLTGSERAGAIVAERAGRSLKKAVLELGGNDPLIVLEDAPLDSALDGALAGRMFNTGQCCVGSKRIIVVGQARGRVFLDGFVQRLASLQPGDPIDPETTLGPLSSERTLNQLLDQIALARKGGGKVALGGNRIDRPGYYLEATVLTDIDRSNPVFDEELFGPVATFHVVDSEEEAIELANATSFGLGASLFTSDLERGRAVAARIESGMVFINQPAWTAAEIPFGGIKNSGFGRELSELGLGEFVNEKLINVARAGAPPWGPAPAS
ncbi:succinate-semialdehyde dehydrogenase [Xanthomonas hortorum pv. hederae]|nr:succinate-semialdehyde dehydrogenase [Xanthomonas hortorum pv. hederae]PUF01281.1 NAD-dependent succinate-semialdehyde dehydrogenase [Xanthomonas hortorum pv. hederae]